MSGVVRIEPQPRQPVRSGPAAHWAADLAYTVTPKSGPLGSMRTVGDAARMLLDRLPRARRTCPYWLAVRRLLLAAAESGSRIDRRLATDALIRALEAEGWMSRVRQ